LVKENNIFVVPYTSSGINNVVVADKYKKNKIIMKSTRIKKSILMT
jgi:hypothetical protein